MVDPARLVAHQLTVSGGQIRCWTTGETADCVVLAGPGFGAATLARRLATLLPDRRALVIELPGIGGSASTEPTSLDAIADALAAALLLLGAGGAPLVAVDLAAAVLPPLLARPAIRPAAVVALGLDRAEAWAARGALPPPIAPTTDGSHLQALWSFLRDLHLLEPADPTQASAVGEPLPSPAELDEGFVAAAVRPERFTAAWKALAGGLGAVSGLDGLVRVGPARDLAAALAAIASRPLPPVPATAPLPGGALWYDHVDTARGRVHLRRAGDAGTPLLVLPTGGGSSEQFAPVVRGLSAGRRVFALDYFGNGLSDRREGEVSVEDLAEDAIAVIEALGFARVDVWGSHTGSLVALELALRRPDLVGRMVLEGPVFVAPDFQADLLDNYFPVVRPDKWGLHLPLVWNWRRDMFLYWPWYRVDRGAVRRLGLPSPAELHLYAIGILESGPTYDRAYRSAFRYPTAERLPRLTRPALV